MELRKSELKAFKSEIHDFGESQDLRFMEGDFIIKQLEEKIKLREMSVEKKILKK